MNLEAATLLVSRREIWISKVRQCSPISKSVIRSYGAVASRGQITFSYSGKNNMDQGQPCQYDTLTANIAIWMRKYIIFNLCYRNTWINFESLDKNKNQLEINLRTLLKWLHLSWSAMEMQLKCYGVAGVFMTQINITHRIRKSSFNLRSKRENSDGRSLSWSSKPRTELETALFIAFVELQSASTIMWKNLIRVCVRNKLVPPRPKFKSVAE